MKPIAKKPSPRRFHQASWDEPVIFELSQPGQRGVLVPSVDPEIENEIVFNYKTPAGNVKKAFFNKLEHAEKVVEDMPNWYVSSIE